MLQAIMKKKRAIISLMTILMVISYVMPSGFHLSFCSEEEHLKVTVADCTDMSFFSSHKGEDVFFKALETCCADLTACSSEISCHPALLLSKQAPTSIPPPLYFAQALATFLVSDDKALAQSFLPPDIPSQNISILRTIILQV
jgi:hypothetical protein